MARGGPPTGTPDCGAPTTRAGRGCEASDGRAVPTDVYAELLRSYEGGVAESLARERANPNPLGNTRMPRPLCPPPRLSLTVERPRTGARCVAFRRLGRRAAVR